MDLFQSMGVFKRVAEIGSFTKVADELGVSQSSISKQVSALEQRLGTKLMNRSTRRLKLSEAGAEYYDRCCAILSDLEETETLISGTQSVIAGRLRINVPDTFGRKRVLPEVWDFLERYPEVELDLIMDDRRVDLVKEGIDVAIRSASWFDPSVVTRKLCDIPRLLVASPDYLERSGYPKSIGDLKNHHCIIYSLAPTGRTWSFSDAEQLRKQRVSGRVRVSSPEAATDAAEKGFGITLSPEWLVREAVVTGRLVVVLQDCQPTPFEVHAVFPERRFIPARVRRFVDYLHSRLGGERD